MKYKSLSLFSFLINLQLQTDNKFKQPSFSYFWYKMEYRKEQPPKKATVTQFSTCVNANN